MSVDCVLGLSLVVAKTPFDCGLGLPFTAARASFSTVGRDPSRLNLGLPS